MDVNDNQMSSKDNFDDGSGSLSQDSPNLDQYEKNPSELGELQDNFSNVDTALNTKQDSDVEGNKEIEENITDDIPDYAFNNKKYDRHKILEEALLNGEMVKNFDSICEDIVIRGKNTFNVKDYLLSLNASQVSKEAFKNNFRKIVDLLIVRTVSLVEVIEWDEDNNPVEIKLLNKKKFNLHLYHKFNDYLQNCYNTEDIYRTPIVYNLSNICEHLKVSRREIEDFCIFIEFNKINSQVFNNLIQEPSRRKIAVAIDLNNMVLGEAVIPLNLLNNFLDYLAEQIFNFMSDINNEKITGLIKKKLHENQIDFSSLKRHSKNPDPHNNNFGVFIRIFYTIINEVYNKSYGVTDKKFKQIESFVVTALIARQYILNIKVMGDNSGSQNRPKNKEIIVVSILLSDVKEVNKSVFRIPLTMKGFQNKLINMSEGDKKMSVNIDEWLAVFRKLNAGNDTIKEILIMKLGETNFYAHRSCVIPLFLGILEKEKNNIKEIIEQFKNVSDLPLKDKEEWEEFIRKYASNFFITVHDCLKSCLMTVKPKSFSGNQTEYWLLRFFLSSDEIKKYKMDNTEMDMSEANKRKMLKEAISSLINYKDTFYSLSEVLGVPYEDFAKDKNSIYSPIVSFFEFVFSLFELLTRAALPKSKRVNMTPHSNKEPSHRQSSSSLEKDKTKGLRGIGNPDSKRNNKENNLSLLKKLEMEYPELENPEKLKRMINDEHDNWNLKIGENRKSSKLAIDGIINNLVLRLDIKKIINEDFDSLYNIIARNNPLLKKIHNQKALKKYIFYKIISEKHRLLNRQTGGKPKNTR